MKEFFIKFTMLAIGLLVGTIILLLLFFLATVIVGLLGISSPYAAWLLFMVLFVAAMALVWKIIDG